MITVLAGNNQFAISSELKQRQDEFVKAYGEAGLEQHLAEAISPAELRQLLMATSLFTPQRFVVLHNLAGNKPASELLLEMLNEVPSEVQLVLVEPQLDKRTSFFKTLHKAGLVTEFNQLSEPELVKWVRSYVELQGGSVNAHDASFLINRAGSDQLRLSHEIEKLTVYNPHVTKKAIELQVEAAPQDTIFQLLEQSLSGQTERALKTLAGLEAAFADPFQIINMLIWQAHILAVVRSAGTTPDSEVAKSFKISPFVVQKTRNLARNLSSQKLKNIINSVAELDLLLKSTAANPWRSLEQTIVSF